MKLALPLLVLLTGLALSGAAGFYSILGLTAIFAGAFWPVVIMGTTLEIAKLVAVSWLYHYWSIAPKMIRAYFLFAIAVLMFITSLGIFGYLSRAHIQKQVEINSGAATNITILDQQIALKEDEVKDIDKQIAVIDDSIFKMIERGQAKSSLSASSQQRKTRNTLVQRKTSILNELAPLKVEKIRLDSDVRKLEAEVGPIKYVAEVIYGESSTEILDKSVRAVIILLILVFDPLAVLLLLAFNIMMSQKKDDYADIEFVEYKPRQRRSKSANTTQTTLPIT